jgi:hypothetical protein
VPYSTFAKNAMLDHLGTLALWMSVHKSGASPGSTGAREMTGSIRQSIIWDPAAGGAKSHSNTPSFTGLSTSEAVGYIGLWSASTGGTWYGYQAVTVTSASGGGTWTYDVLAGFVDLNATASA